MPLQSFQKVKLSSTLQLLACKELRYCVLSRVDLIFVQIHSFYFGKESCTNPSLMLHEIINVFKVHEIAGNDSRIIER